MTVYYVSPAGSDANAGTSTAAPWRTLGKAAATTLLPGDKALLECGGVWRETFTPTWSGTIGNLIAIGSYGTGDPPIIKGSDVLSTSGWGNLGSVIRTIPIGASGDDGYVQNSGPTYPPAGGAVAVTNGISIPAELGLNAGTYVHRLVVLRFDTSVLAGAAVTNATLRVYSRIPDWFDADNRSLLGDWIPDPGVIDTGDYAAPGTLTGSAFNLDITGVAHANATIDIPLTAPGVNVDANGITALRIGVSGGQPTGRNGVGFAAVDHTSQQEPQLIVTYTGTAATFTKTLATTPGDGHVLEDGVPLEKVASVAEVEAAAGSWYWASNVLYLHTSDGSDPASNGRTYEVSQRDYCVNGANRDYLRWERIMVSHSREEGLRASPTSDFWEWDGVVAAYCGWQGLKVDGTGHTMVDPEAYGSRRFGGIGVDQQGSVPHHIINPNVHHNGVDWWADHGLYCSSAVGSGDVIVMGGASWMNAAHGVKAGGVTDVSARRFQYMVSWGNGHSGFFVDTGITNVYWHHLTSVGNRNGFHLYDATAAVHEMLNSIATGNLYDDANDPTHTQTGRGVYNNGGTIAVRDYNIIWNNPVRGVTAATHELDDNPLYVDAANHDYRLTAESPARDRGTVIPGIDQQVSGAAPDIGAFEYSEAEVPRIVDAALILTELDAVLTQARENEAARLALIDPTADAEELAIRRRDYTIAGGVVAALESARRSAVYLT